MGRYTHSVLVYIGAMVLLVGLSTSGSILYEPVAETAPWLTLTALTILAAISHLYPVKSAKQGIFYVLASTFQFAAVFLVPGWMLPLFCAGALLPVTLRDRARSGAWLRYVFNTAQSTLAGYVAWAIVVLGAATDLSGLIDILVVLFALIAFVTLQHLFVAGIIALNRKTALHRLELFTVSACLADSLPPFLGVLIAALWYNHLWILVLSMVPLVVVYRLMRQIQLVTQIDLDPKTGLYNFRYFQRVAQEEICRGVELRRPVALLFCDMDYLRDVNNTYGHLAGDRVLDQLAMLMTRRMPSTSVISRFGGEEFVILLPGTDREQACYLAEGLRVAVRDHTFIVADGTAINVTVSIGVSGAPADGVTQEVLLDKADRAVYKAKDLGRNRVCLYDHTLSATPSGELVQARSSFAPAPPPDCLPPAADARPVSSPSAPDSEPAEVAAVASSTALRAGTQIDLPRLIVITAGLMATAIALSGLQGDYPWPLLGLCVLAGIGAEWGKIPLLTANGHSASVSPAVAVSLAAGALLGLSGAVVVALGNALAHSLGTKSGHLVRTAFNAAVIVLANFSSGLIFQLIGVPQATSVAGWHLPATLIATVVSFLVNTGLLAAVVARNTQRPFFSNWWRSFGWLAPHFVLMGITGVFVVFAYRAGGYMGAVLAVAPLLIARYNFVESVASHNRSLEEVRRAHRDLQRSQAVQVRTLDELMQTISAMIDARDFSMSGHSEQVSRYAVALARELNLPAKDVDHVRLAGLLHDLGKIGVPEGILHKPAALTPDEWDVVREHAVLGERILTQVTALDEVARIVGEYHERFDGRGYPCGRAGSEISIGARIVAVADALDTIISGRPHAGARPLSWALTELVSCAGSQFDPIVVAALIRLVDAQGPGFFAPSQRQRIDLGLRKPPLSNIAL